MKDELSDLMGSEKSDIYLKSSLTVILISVYKVLVKQHFQGLALYLKQKFNKRYTFGCV